MDNSNPTGKSARTWTVGLGLLLIVVIGSVWWWRQSSPPPARPTASPSSEVRQPVKDRPVIDYNALSEDQKLREMMAQRKQQYGVGQELDLVVTGNETLRIGDQTVSMSDIQRQIALKEGRILESTVGGSGPSMPEEIYGIHVVQPGENLWNIHFTLLKGYFERRGTRLAPLADEPHQNGSSSGVGRLLKFSEGMVYIYNLRERRLDPKIDSIYPRSKIVVYRMKPVFALLEQIDAAALDRIRFDGDTLWLPAQR
jgi:hypothetical protein